MRDRQFDSISTPKWDYLKYYRVIHFYMKLKYKLTSTELDMLIFLHSEKYFTTKDIKEYYNYVMWDTQRFRRMREGGWIDVFPRETHDTRVVYNLSMKAKRLINEMYDIIAGKDLPKNAGSNPFLKKDIRFTDKVHRIAMKQMRAWVKKEVKKNNPQLAPKRVLKERRRLKEEAAAKKLSEE